MWPPRARCAPQHRSQAVAHIHIITCIPPAGKLHKHAPTRGHSSTNHCLHQDIKHISAGATCGSDTPRHSPPFQLQLHLLIKLFPTTIIFFFFFFCKQAASALLPHVQAGKRHKTSLSRPMCAESPTVTETVQSPQSSTGSVSVSREEKQKTHELCLLL